MNSIPKGLLILSFIVSLGGVCKVHAIAGKIVYSYGQVEATSATGAIRPLARGDVIESGESVRTINGRTQIRFTDGGFVALQPNTQYRLEDYNFEGTVDGSEKSFFYLVEGSIRLVTGLIGRSNKENFQLTTPVASIGIRGTSGKCTHTEAGGTQLAGYGGVWNLTSGAFSGPVEPGQAYSCNGSTCAEIPGFGQRQETASENQEEQEEEEEEEEEEEQEEGQEEQNEEVEDGEESEGEGQTDSEGEEEAILLAESEGEENEEGITLTESDNEEDGLSITSSSEEETGFVANREDEGGEEAFFEVIVQGDGIGIGTPNEPNEIELTLGESPDTTKELGLGAFAAGEQTDSDGQFEVIQGSSNNRFDVRSVSETVIGVSGLQDITLNFGSFTENTQAPITFATNDGTIFFKNDQPVGGLALDTFFGESSLGFFVADFEAVRLGLISLSGTNPALSDAGLNALNSISQDKLTRLSSNPAEFVDGNISPDGFLSFGRWQDGFVLDIDASPSGTVRSNILRELVGFQSEHVITGNRVQISSNQLARYDLTGGTRSTSSDSNQLGSGLISGKILFDFGSGYGSLEASLSHALETHNLFGDLVLTENTFVGPNGIAINSSGNTHRADFSGFFTGTGVGTPQAVGLNYGVHTSKPIIGAASFGLNSVGLSNLRDAENGTFVGISHSLASLSNQILDSDAYIFKVNGSNTQASLSGNILHSFVTNEPTDRCGSDNCVFNKNTAPVTVDSTGPSTFDPRANTTIPGWSNTELGVNWARFGSGYNLSHDNLAGKVGSAHLITFKNPTSVSEIPTSGTATYNAIRGGTHPTATFVSNGVVQPEVVGTLTQAQVTIDWGTRAINTNLQGVFPDGGNGGSFQLTGSGTGSFSTGGGLTAFNLAGGVTSARISDNAGNNCAGGCNLNGRTDQILVGQFARAIGGSFHGNVQNTFSVNGTYLLEQSANIAAQPTVSARSERGLTN